MVIRSADKSRSEEEAAPRASSVQQLETILNDWTPRLGTKNNRFGKKHHAICKAIEDHNRKRKATRSVT
jgi:hypothetical protein